MSCLIFLHPPFNFVPRFEVASSYSVWQFHLLLLKRQSHKTHGNTWGVPGGKLEKSEMPREAIIRELFEELGVSVNPAELQFFQTLYIQQDGLDFIYHMFYIALNQLPLIVLNLEEHQEYQWVMLSKVMEMPLMPGERETLSFFFELSSISIGRNQLIYYQSDFKNWHLG